MEHLSTLRFHADDLLRLVESLLRTAGAHAAGAAAVARAVVEASAYGVDTHGVRLVPHYVRTLESGRIKPAPDMRLTRSAPAAALLDADDGFGHEASYRAIEEGVALASATGIAAVAVVRSSHHGATGCYTREAARRGYAALGMTNADAIVVPHGGPKPFYGTNPLSFALPVEGEEPMVLDMATSSIPWNRVLLRRATGTPLPPDVAVDDLGRTTTDPGAATALHPLGGTEFGYKGAGLAAMVDLLCSAFIGMGHGAILPPFGGPDLSQPASLGHVFIVLRPDIFVSLTAFNAGVARFLADLRAQPAQPGHRVMAPGDPEVAEAAHRRTAGIPLDETTWADLRSLADRYGCVAPQPLQARPGGRRA